MQLGLFRILGNALPPRDSMGARIKALRQIMELEADQGIEVNYVINFMHHRGYNEEIHELLNKHGRAWSTLTFDARLFRSMTEAHQRCYAVNINAARNHALHRGFEDGYDFVAVLDQDCFATKDEWDDIKLKIRSDAPQLKYYSLMSHRIHRLNENISRVPAGEPMLIHRHDAEMWYDPMRTFGSRDKLDLALRLGHNMHDWDGLQRNAQTRIVGSIRHYSIGDTRADDQAERHRLRTKSVDQLMETLRKRYPSR